MSVKALGAFFSPAAANRKLAPVEMQANTTERLRPVPVGPFCASTYVSIDKTCPDSCGFKAEGCYVRTGFTAQLARELDTAAAPEPGGVIRAEAMLIDQAFPVSVGPAWKRSGRRGGPVPQDGARGGRDLRLHVGGDCPDTASARVLAEAAARWRARGGGDVWTYTHRWREIPREAWGSISVLASCETPADVMAARGRGYAPAIVVRRFPDRRAFYVSGIVGRVIPCPAETGKRSCVECRLCFDDRALYERAATIAFEAHGGLDGAQKARRSLPVMRQTAAPDGGTQLEVFAESERARQLPLGLGEGEAAE